MSKNASAQEGDFLLSSYHYELPEERIAQYPDDKPGGSRLMVMERAETGKEKPSTRHAFFADLPDLLPAESLLVANNTRVLPARIVFGRAGGGRGEFLLLTPLPLLLETARESSPGNWHATVECLLRPGAKFRPGSTFGVAPGLAITVLEKKTFGRHLVELEWVGDLEAIFLGHGSVPLPPYIRRQTEESDLDRYQTAYAKRIGAVAAPTAGLHFTPEIMRRLLAKGHEWCEVCLHTGYGTFSPVRTHDIRDHRMHAEFVEISSSAAQKIRQATAGRRPVIAIGTTSLRALEGVWQNMGAIGEFRGWTDIFLYPGKKFFVINGLITNFHLPESSLLMLVSAFAGRKRVLAAYSEAISNGYRFFSYGDAMLIRP